MAYKTHSRIRELTYIALFAALLVVCTWIALPTQPPFTMQSFAVFAAALTLGRKGASSVAVYLLLGILGVPIFAGFSGGLGAIAGPTGGFLIGFLPAALIVGHIAEKSRRIPLRMLGCAAGTAVCYLLGTVWFMRAGGSMSPGAAITCCVLPFLIPDVCKIVLACLISRRITPLFGTAPSQK